MCGPIFVCRDGGKESEGRIHGVFDRCHGERVEEFETVENSEPLEHPFFAQQFKMSPETIM